MATGEITLTRLFEAPIQLVWGAWTRPEHFSKWWGPKSYTSPQPQIDLRVGGKLLWAMQSPQGDTHYNAGVFREVKAPHQLVCDIWFADANGNKAKPPFPGMPEQQTIHVTLEEVGKHTRMTMRQTGVPEGDIRRMAEAGWSTSIDKLHESLVHERAIILGREFDAPRSLVWEAWTKPEHTARWWGPNGFKTITREMDLRVGGLWVYNMIGPDGSEYPNRIEYIEIVKPARLVYRNGTSADDPEWFRATITFMEFMGRTRVNMISVFPTREAREEVASKYGAVEGGVQHLASLAEYLKTMA